MTSLRVHRIDRPELLRTLVAQAIPRLEWAHNGLGILQGFIREPELRVHVWHPSLVTEKAQPSKIHDHRFDLVSSVLLGSVVHAECSLVPDPVGEWVVRPIDGSSAPPPSVRYGVSMSAVEVRAGSYYTFPKGLFHSVTSEGLAVTLCEKKSFEPERPVLGVQSLVQSRELKPVSRPSFSKEEVLALAEASLLEP